MQQDFQDWVGRSQSVTDRLEPTRSGALGAALGHPTSLEAGAPLPLLHHWLYFWDVQPPASLGQDGHPARGGFLPPVPLPRRMWAGGCVRFHRPLLMGEAVTRTSTIQKVETKNGKSGTLVFVTVEHRIEGPRGLALTEEQDLVYRDATTGPAAAIADVAPDAPWHETIRPDPVLLFRYSALTMNGHRIHYDRPYAIDEEGYPALVVHGPLQATLLIALAARSLDAPIATFDFRGQSPAFDTTPLHICGMPADTGASLWTEQGGTRNMVATVTCQG